VRTPPPKGSLVRLWPGFLARLRPPERLPLTTVEVSYVAAFEVDDRGGRTAIAWWAKSETAYLADGSVWSRRHVLGPGIDTVDLTTSLPSGVNDLVVGYPVRLGARLFTVRATAPGDIHEVTPVGA